MTDLEFFWLGPPIIKRNTSAVHMETRKATALLAFISLSTSPLSREKLATLFWPNSDQTHAQANFRRALFSINQSIGYNALLSSTESIGIDPNSLILQDVNTFQTLSESVISHLHTKIASCPECINNLEIAIAHYRGDFLEGLNLRECPEFDQWQNIQRVNFQLTLASNLEKLSAAYTSLSEWEKAIQIAHQWVSLDPLNENAQRMLIKANIQAGYRGAAINQFEEFSNLLQNDVGFTPEEATVALLQEIRPNAIGKQDKSTEEPAQLPLKQSAKQPILKTKLYVPHPRAKIVSRQGLMDKMDRGTQGALTIISAPAGYGKTTLISEWISTRNTQSHPWAFCWLSLDPGDNDPTRFLTYLTAALMKNIPEFSSETQTLLQSNQPILATTPLSMLINDLEELPKSILLVLDDYQFISNQAIHEGITFLLEHIPPNVHIVIATRSDPPLPLARLRALNQLTEIRASHLQFTSLETTEFLNSIFDLMLTPQQIQLLENRTEGWIAGLQMAAISLQDRTDVNQFIEKFSGSHRYIMDYLAEEALNNQTTEVQEFLLQTSILGQLCDSLCRYILEIDPQHQDNDPQTVASSNSWPKEHCKLVDLELSNLFIVPLDDDRIWYRYHHLFADLLRSRLKQKSPGIIPILHSRASRWFEMNGWVEESINHALAAKDWANATRLITHHFIEMLDNGQMATLLDWIKDLPQEVIFQNPLLCEQVAEIYSQAGMIEQIDPYLDKAEELLSSKPSQEEDAIMVRSMVAILRGLKAVCMNSPEEALTFTQQALIEYPQMKLKEQAVLLWVEGWAKRNLGQLKDALETFTKANNIASLAGVFLRDIWTDLAFTNRMVGNLNQAKEILTTALGIASTHGINEQGNLSRGESFLSFIYLEQNQLDLALLYANRAISHTHWWPSHNIIATAYTSLAQIRLAQNDQRGSLQAIEKADRERKNRIMTPFVHTLVEVTQVQIWLANDDWELINEWSTGLVSALPPSDEELPLIDDCLEMRLIMLIRVWINQTKFDRKINRYYSCLTYLNWLEENATKIGQLNSLVEILFLQATIYFELNKVKESIDCLERCLQIAEPGGYKRIILITGKPAYELLSSTIEDINPKYRAYAKNLLNEFGENKDSHYSIADSPETITEREMEVLNLLALGYSNRRIAEELTLSEGTIKFHVHNLLGKLQVENRTQAIVKSKAIGLLGE
ncbi:hypothetical protein JR338_05705 [Chloroflexota bacterium]|nr:hypothetical protein JR338_05705 [Chloroflexota bacterium]